MRFLFALLRRFTVRRSSGFPFRLATGLAVIFAAGLPAQIVRPGGPDITPVNPGTGPINPGGPIVIGPGGVIGGGTSAAPEPVIIAARGALLGQTLTAAITFPAAGQTATAATYQWSITGGRLLTDPRERTVDFTADRAGLVTLTATVGANGTSYTPTASVTFFASDAAGAVTAPASVVTGTATVNASVPAAQNGDRTFRWTVSGDAAIASGQNTATLTFRPGTPGLKEIVCNVTLQNLVTVPVRAYLVVTGDGSPTPVTVVRGTGSGTFRAGTRVELMADPPASGEVFDRWVGDTSILGTGTLAATLARTTLTVPDTPVTLTATYKSTAEWTALSVRNFNPQPQTASNGAPAATVATTLDYFLPPAPRALVFLLHDSGAAGADWFERPEQILLTRDLVAAGFGVAALTSLNRTAGTWAAQATLATNPDALNHVAVIERLVREGSIGAATPLFLVGVGNGADAAVRFAELLVTGRPARAVKGTVLYLGTGNDTLAVTSRVPQFFALAANDETVGAAGLATARENMQFLQGRGIATALVTNPVSPVPPERFRLLGVSGRAVSTEAAQGIWEAVRTTGALDANRYVKALPTVAALSAALPASQRDRAGDVLAQLAVAAAGRAFFSDADSRVIAFLNARIGDVPVSAPGRIVNLSTRSRISYLGDTLTLGFTLTGTQRATLLLRGVGPGLARFGVGNPLPALQLEVRRGNTSLGRNDAWSVGENSAPIAAAAASVGAFALPAGSLDAALLLQLDPGTYLATISGRNGAVGDFLGELYDVSRNSTRLTNLAVLANLSTAGDLLIPGFVIAGNNPRSLLVRAVGPSLASIGLPAHTVLEDPRLTLFSGPQSLATNNNWAQAGAATLNAVFPAVGAFPLTAANDAALVLPLNPGTYTLQASATPTFTLTPGSNQPVITFPENATGLVLVEMYEIP